MVNETVSLKKRALVARKEKLLQDIQYYEKRIADFHASKSSTSIFEDNCSSDSDSDLPVIDNGPSVTQLKLEQSHLKTSLQATQELTNLHLLEHEVNIMVKDPVIVEALRHVYSRNEQMLLNLIVYPHVEWVDICEPEVREPGVWREVIAECRLDLVPFSIAFHVHKPSVKFGAPSYRNLKVILTKPAHETELVNSVLTYVTTPSDAIEVLRSYSLAHRSRRTTLARLAEKYPNLLFMEPLAEGGYILKCAGLLEVCWTLQNKWSPIAPFHHRMRFDLEYMDESYIKTITQYHRQLSDPSLETDERTAILSKIINTCLEAKGPTQELYESMESDDPETAQTLKQRRMTLDQEVTETAPKRKRDDAIMAPPKSLPKKSKAKGKENKVQSNDDRNVSKVRSDVPNESERGSIASGKSKDSRKYAKSTKEIDGRKDSTKLAKDATDSNKNERPVKAIPNNRKDNTNEVANSGKENAKSTKEIVRKEQTSAKEREVKKDTVAKSKDNATDRNDEKSTKEVAKTGKENAKPNVGTGSKKDLKSAKGKDTEAKTEENAPVQENNEERKSVAKATKKIDNKKDGSAKTKGNTEVTNSVAKSTKEVSDSTKNKKKVQDHNNLNENNARTTKTVDEGVNLNPTVASNKAPKKSTNSNLEDGKKNSVIVSKKSITNKVKENVNVEKDKGDNVNTNNDKLNTDKGNMTKANAKTKDADMNKNVERSVPKKVKKTDDISNVPTKKAKIDHTTKISGTIVKSTEKPKKSVNNINKPPIKSVEKTANLNKNAVKTKEVEKKNSTYTKTSETNQKVTEINEIVTNKPDHAVHTDIAKTSTTKNSNTYTKNPKKYINVNEKVKNTDQNMKNNIHETKKSFSNVPDKMKSVKNNTENDKNLNNDKIRQKLKMSTGNTKVSGVKKLSAGSTVRETSTESKISKIPQSLTKIASSLKKNPLRISPRKLSSTLKNALGVKNTIQKPITSIPRLLVKPVVKNK